MHYHKSPKDRAPMTISDEAVEAAAWVLDPGTMGSGGALADKFREATRAEARKILEAAAPHMLAEAWDDGWYERAEYDGAQRIPEETPNPHRPERG